MNDMQPPRVILKLNTSVLNALFPENGEARVQLQQAVLAELTRATIKGAITGDLSVFLKNFTDEVAQGIDVEKMIEGYFTTSGSYWNRKISVTPDTKLTKLLADTVNSVIDEKFSTAVEEAVQARMQKYIDEMTSRVEYAVKQKVDRLTTDAINTRVNAAVEAARATL